MMVTTSFGFYAWFWGRSGQTLGMIAWRLRAQRPDGQLLTLPQSALRFVLAWPSFFLLGIGFFWLLINRQQGTLHDRFSDTRWCWCRARIVRSEEIRRLSLPAD